MNYWKVFCMENKWPGLWRRCFQHQAASVGWPPQWRYRLEGKTRASIAWSRARRALQEIRPGDMVVVQLQGNRVGRIGEVVRLAVADSQWDPLVPKSKREEVGEMGRRIIVRWDLVNGPSDPDLVVHLPPNARLTPGISRPTVCAVPKSLFKRVAKAVSDKANWVPVSAHVFRHEESISDYLGSYPHHLEDGLQPYPSLKVREAVFSDKTRSDVLLIDRHGKPVIIECKQGSPTRDHVDQLRGYLRKAANVTGKRVRGILVHGGSGKVPKDVRRHSQRHGIEVVRYALAVNFSQTV